MINRQTHRGHDEHAVFAPPDELLRRTVGRSPGTNDALSVTAVCASFSTKLTTHKGISDTPHYVHHTAQ